MNVAVRIVRNDSDFERLHELFVAYEADLPARLRHGAIPSTDDLARAYAGTNAAFLAEVEGECAGCVALRAHNPESVMLRHLFVTPERRGCGAARSLVSAAIDFARRNHYRRIVLDTSKEELEPAYALYRSLGFEECEPFATVTYECPTYMELALEP